MEYATVQENIDQGVKSSQLILDAYNEKSMKLADPDITDEIMTTVLAQLETLTEQIDAGELWELERVVSRAMDSLRVPSGDALVANLSGGEKRRTALCRLLLENHDMLLLDEVRIVRSWQHFVRRSTKICYHRADGLSHHFSPSLMQLFSSSIMWYGHDPEYHTTIHWNGRHTTTKYTVCGLVADESFGC